MTTRATGVRKLTRWEDTTLTETDGAKLVRSAVDYAYTGDVEGQATLEYVMLQRPDWSATFVGFEVVTGRIGDRSGSFVLRHSGELSGGKATVTLTVLPESGTGELAGLTGEGQFVGVPEDKGNGDYALDYDL